MLGCNIRTKIMRIERYMRQLNDPLAPPVAPGLPYYRHPAQLPFNPTHQQFPRRPATKCGHWCPSEDACMHDGKFEELLDLDEMSRSYDLKHGGFANLGFEQ